MMPKLCWVILTCLCLAACQTPTARPVPAKLSKDQQIRVHLDSLEKTASDGDLVVRLGDDMISYQVKNLNEKDRSYSHAGMILQKAGRKWVIHITPEEASGDTIQLTPIDSFLAPGKNLQCALYRYQLSAEEKNALHDILDQLRAQHIHFDKLYDLATDDQLYCSEMISKALTRATNGRLVFKTSNTPPGMVPLLYNYLKKEKVTRKMVTERKFVTIDNLYLKPECNLVMQFPLKFFPGQ